MSIRNSVIFWLALLVALTAFYATPFSKDVPDYAVLAIGMAIALGFCFIASRKRRDS